MKCLPLSPGRRLGWRCLVWLLAASWMLCTTGSFAEGNRHALLIGIDEYQSLSEISVLEYAETDVVELSRVLREQGYHVVELVNHRATREEIVRELIRLSLQLDEDDEFLLYFSGHGIRNVLINQKAYWLTYRTSLAFLEVEGIRLSHMLDYVADIKAGRKLVLLDHCFSGDLEELPENSPNSTASVDLDATAISDSEGTRAAERPIGLVRGKPLDTSSFDAGLSNAPTGLVVLAASRNLALESGILGHGVFTQAVLEAIRDLKADTSDSPDEVTAFEFISYVEARVPLLAAQHHFNQSVVPKITGATHLNEWVLAVNPGNTMSLATATVLVGEYKQKLAEMLQRRQHLALPQKFKWELLLDEWIASLTTDVPLSADDQWLVEQIRAVMADDTISDVNKAKALNDAMLPP